MFFQVAREMVTVSSADFPNSFRMSLPPLFLMRSFTFSWGIAWITRSTSPSSNLFCIEPDARPIVCKQWCQLGDPHDHLSPWDIHMKGRQTLDSNMANTIQTLAAPPADRQARARRFPIVASTNIGMQQPTNRVSCPTLNNGLDNDSFQSSAFQCTDLWHYWLAKLNCSSSDFTANWCVCTWWSRLTFARVS